MKSNHPFHYRVDFVDEKIEISNTFAKAAQKANTSAHKQLMAIRKAYPGFGVTIYKTEIKDSKQKYKGLNFEEMRHRIIEWDGKNARNLTILDKAIVDKVPYPKVKQWYLGIYGDHYKRTTDVSAPIDGDTAAVGLSDTGAGNC